MLPIKYLKEQCSVRLD